MAVVAAGTAVVAVVAAGAAFLAVEAAGAASRLKWPRARPW